MANNKTTVHIDATHMGNSSLQDDDTPQIILEQDEDWGEIAEDLVVEKSDNAEKVASLPCGEKTDQTQTRSMTMSQQTVETNNVSTPTNTEDYFAMMEKLETLKQNAINEVQAKLASLEQERAECLAKLEKLGIVTTQPKKKYALRSASAENNGDSTSSSIVGRKTRPKNEKTLKEAIVDVLHKKNRVNLKDLADLVLENGFKTNSQKFSNTVRVQLYRLEEDRQIVQYDDKTFGLVKK